jgi:hypothetical protein
VLKGRRIALLLCALGLAIIAGSLANSARGSATACKAGAKKVAGGTARTYCNAKATVHANGHTYAVKGGRCDLYPTYVSVRIGSVAKKGTFFGLFIGKSPVSPATEPVVARDGTYNQGLIVLANPKVLAFLLDEADLKVVLTKGRRQGRFSGTNPASAALKRAAVTLTGTFSC